MTFSERENLNNAFVNDKWIIPFIINEDKIGFCNEILRRTLKSGKKEGIQLLDIITKELVKYTKDKTIPSLVRTFIYNSVLELYIQLGLRASL